MLGVKLFNKVSLIVIYDIGDFIAAPDDKILEYNNMNRKKWDVVLMNPPFSGRTGLHLKFLNKVCEISDIVCSILPGTFIKTKSTGGFMKSIYDKARSYINDNYSEIEIIDNNKVHYFNAGILGDLAISYINKLNHNKGEKHIIINYKDNIYKFDNFNDIILENNKYVKEFLEKIKAFDNTHDLFYNTIVYYNINKIRERDIKAAYKNNKIDDNIKNNDKIIPVARELAIFSNDFIRSDINNPILYKDLNTTCYVHGNKNSNNIIKYLKSNFAKMCLFVGYKFTGLGYKYLPLIDFSKSYTDEELFNMIGMKYDKEEVENILSEKG